MNYLEKKLAKHFDKKYCLFTGNGTTAIYLILKALNMTNKKVLYPAITCMNPVNSAVYAGYETVFCDVNLDNYTMDLESLKKVIELYDVGIIVPTHIYGHKCNMKEILKIAKEKKLFVIEDSAQTVEFTNADVSIISFGHTKIYECSKGGGAVFTNNEDLYKKICDEKSKLHVQPSNSNELYDEYRQKYYYIMNEISSDDKKWNEMLKLQLEFKDAFIYDMDSYEEVIDKLEKENCIFEKRIKRAELYKKHLEKKLISVPKLSGRDILWRYSFLFNGDRKRLLSEVRKENVDISSWYPALYKMYSNQCKELFTNSNILEEEIVNLWIDPEYTENKILDDIQKINCIMTKMKN